MNLKAPNYRIIGDSHVYPLASAAKELAQQLDASGFRISAVRSLAAATDFYVPFHQVRDGKIRFLQKKMHDRMTSLCDEEGSLLPPDDAVWLISLGTHTSTFLSGARWKAHRHWQVHAESGLQPLSSGVFDAMVLGLNSHILTFFSDLVRLGYRFSVISSPPPTRRFRLLGEGYSVDDLLFLDGCARTAVQKELEAMGLPFISPPEGVAPDGLLDDRYLFDDEADVHHGNVLYSQAMLKHIARVVLT